MSDKEAKAFAKKPYVTPRLTVHGSVEKITEAGVQGNADGAKGSVKL